MTNLPKKITPDRIKDAIVTIHYSTNLPYEILLGKFYEILVKELKFSPLFINTNSVFGKDILNQQQEGIVINFSSPEWLFHNESIKVVLKPYEIVFNIIDEYISWNSYFPLIKSTINALFESKNIVLFNSFQIRYISHYPDTDLSDKVDVSLKIQFDDSIYDNTSFRTILRQEELSATINIVNKLTNTLQSKNFLSVIDVMVKPINDRIDVRNTSNLFYWLDKAHAYEKDTIFKILREDYVNSQLNPEF